MKRAKAYRSSMARRAAKAALGAHYQAQSDLSHNRWMMDNFVRFILPKKRNKA